MNLKLCVVGAMLFSSYAAQAAEEQRERDWSVSLSGSIISADGEDQNKIGLGVTRNIGDGFLGLSASITNTNGEAATAAIIPAKTTQVKLSGGYSFDALSVDGYASIGKRNFSAQKFQRRDGQQVEIDSNGDLFAMGGAFTYDIDLTDHLVLSPYLSVDYSKIDTARTIPSLGGRLLSRTQSEDGVTTTFGATSLFLFGSDEAHNFGPNIAYVSSSNSTASLRGTSIAEIGGGQGLRDQDGVKDNWLEFGASASFKLTDTMRLDFSASQTSGFFYGDSFAAFTAVRFKF